MDLNNRKITNNPPSPEDWIFLNMADQSYFAKIVLITHDECSQADIAQNLVNLTHNKQRTLTN